MRIVFMGTPDFAVPTLNALVAGGHDVAAVYTRAPRPAGRGMSERKSPVQVAAERLNIPLRYPASLQGAVADFRALDPDAAVVVAYGLLLPKDILAVPEFGCLNLHASLLPRWRGAAPINRAVMAGDAATGVAVMRMEEGLDTGPVGLVEEVAIAPDMTAGELHDRLAMTGAALMVQALAALATTGLQFTPQENTGVTYAKKLGNSETRIDWSKPARAVHDHIRGLSPFPGAWFELAAGKEAKKTMRVRALRSTLAEGSGKAGTVIDDALDDRLTIACGDGAVRLLEVQRAGARAMPTAEFLRGLPAKPAMLA